MGGGGVKCQHLRQLLRMIQEEALWIADLEGNINTESFVEIFLNSLK